MQSTPIGRLGQAFLVCLLFTAAAAPALAAPTAFATIPSLDPPITPPYWEGFDTYPPTGWTEATGLLADPITLTGTSSGWTHGAFGNIGTTNDSAKLHVQGAGVREWMFTPAIDLYQQGGVLNLRFRLALTESNGTGAAWLGADDTFAVVISTDGGVTWSSANVLQQWYPSSPISNTGDYINIIPIYAFGVVMFGFYAESTVSNANYDLFIDDVEIMMVPLAVIPDCAIDPSPATGATGVSTSASLSWQEAPVGIQPDGFKVYFGTVNPPTTEVADQWPPYTPGTLDFGTTYYWRIEPYSFYGQNICPVWSFTTQANPNYGSGGGYNYSNSTPGGAGSPFGQPTYSWIAEHTHEVTTWTNGDGNDGTFSLDLTPYFSGGFPYFGAVYSQLQIGSNGHIIVGTAPAAPTVYGQNPFPNTLAPNNVIAGAWANLDLRPEIYPDAHVYYGGDASHFVITYWHAHGYSATPNPNYVTFQILLYPDGKIIMQYNDAESVGTTVGSPSIQSDAVIGIENNAGTQGLGYRVDGVGGPMFGSPLALAIVPDGVPLAVDLAGFWANLASDRVELTWETVSELNNAGFTLYRGSTADGANRTRLAYLPSQAPGATQGASYSYQDSAVITDQTYWYWLEAVDLSGATTLYGPVSVTVAIPTGVKLSELDAGATRANGLAWPLSALASTLALALGGIARRHSLGTN